MTDRKDFDQDITDFISFGEKIYQKSKEIIHLSQTQTGATTASLNDTRYSGYCYPRDHAYTIRAFIKLNQQNNAHNALTFLTTCELDDTNILYQRYSTQGINASYKPPQIDGNAQTLLAFAAFIKTYKNAEFTTHIPTLKRLLNGIISQKHDFTHGSLIYAINGILEYSVFEKGYELYTNAVCYRALCEISDLPGIFGSDLCKQLAIYATQIQQGISYYLYSSTHKTFFSCLRTEPDVSLVTLPNLKSYLALNDFAVFPQSDTRVQHGLQYHLKGTKNNDVGGYNRYHNLMGRHNFGNGPWPMVMCRLAQYYMSYNEFDKAKACVNWVLQVAKHNQDAPLCLPEHISSKKAFLEEYEAFQKYNETSPRPAKEREYGSIIQSQTYKMYKIAYAVNPLVWSHAQFIMTWSELIAHTQSHTH